MIIDLIYVYIRRYYVTMCIYIYLYDYIYIHTLYIYTHTLYSLYIYTYTINIHYKYTVQKYERTIPRHFLQPDSPFQVLVSSSAAAFLSGLLSRQIYEEQFVGAEKMGSHW
jgi:hypothetical protein